ncbi:MAG: hypothetical protein CXT67_09735 [Methanobacteriota archaeon]|nr:MAG: hypothetical protein CXT67_09735 [Euryarchaeota archaeon]
MANSNKARLTEVRNRLSNAYDIAKSDPIPLDAALAALAEYFNEEGDVWDYDERDFVKGNLMKFTQENVIQSICWKAATMKQQSTLSVEKALKDLEIENRTSRGDEIGQRNVMKKIRWAKRMNSQKAAVDSLYESITALYYNLFDVVFIDPKPKAIAPMDKTNEHEINEELAALGITTPVAKDNTNGVETTDLEADEMLTK